MKVAGPEGNAPSSRVLEALLQLLLGPVVVQEGTAPSSSGYRPLVLLSKLQDHENVQGASTALSLLVQRLQSGPQPRNRTVRAFRQQGYSLSCLFSSLVGDGALRGYCAHSSSLEDSLASINNCNA